MEKHDVVVIGAGTGGQTAAVELAVQGYSVAVVEQSKSPGGVCALHGCQAKKYFYEVTELAAKANHLQGLGIASVPTVNWREISAAKNIFTSQVPDNTRANLRGSGVTYMEGKASFISDTELMVAEKKIEADYFVIACGAVPMQLPIDGGEHLITSNDFLALEQIPTRIVFIGGGFISFEFAHFAARLGSKPGEVHILEVMERPLGPFDQEMVAQLVAASAHDGINVQSGVSISSIEKTEEGFVVHLQSGNTIETDLVVHGAGRIPAIDHLGLDNAGVTATRRGIQVDSMMRTSAPNIFAVGDCAASIQLARVADREALIAASNILADKEGTERTTISYDAVPAVLFTYPQLAMVGKTEEQLIEDGVKFWKSSETEIGWPTYRRIGMRHAAYKILVDAENRVLGAHVLSDNATGIINTFKQAMLDGTDIEKLRDAAVMSPYPSRESDILYMLNPLLD